MDVPRLQEWSAQAASLEGKRGLPAGHPRLEGMNWSQHAKWAETTSHDTGTDGYSHG